MAGKILSQEILFTTFILSGMMVSCQIKKQVHWMPEQLWRVGNIIYSHQTPIYNMSHLISDSISGLQPPATPYCVLPTVVTQGILTSLLLTSLP